jgi:glycosyltransferase involved in cell wall biosynthesis
MQNILRIVAIIDNKQTSGGGFNQALNSIIQMNRICKGKFDFQVLTTHRENKSTLDALGIKNTYYRFGIIDKFASILLRTNLLSSLNSKIKFTSPIERKCLKLECDLIYFVTPSSIMHSIQKLNFITTVWDLAHRQNPEFPEVREYGKFTNTENLYQINLPKAYLIITDSTQLSGLLEIKYGIQKERILLIPFSVSPLLNLKLEKNILKTEMSEDDYFFYPAQFWPHKNHIRIFEALEILRDKFSWKPKIFLTGYNHGNLSFLMKWAKDHNLDSQINYLHFVESSKISDLYKNAFAVIMPTYFGPTNLPPLEAWKYGTPLINSKDLEWVSESNALLIDPDDVNTLVSAMTKVKDLETRTQIVAGGLLVLEEINSVFISQESKLKDELRKYEIRKATWK